MNKKQRDVYEVLKTPIICKKDCEKLTRKYIVILTSQKYYSTPDEDMSDFAMGFYKILYGDLLDNNEILNDEGNFVNNDFAGDTMNSFNTIANMVHLWKGGNLHLDPFLIFYKSQYHSLANFWVIPMRHGRKSAKKNKYDSLELYLDYVERNWDELKKPEKVPYEFSDGQIKNCNNYFRKFGDFADFKKRHFVEEINTAGIQEMYDEGRWNEIIERILTNIDKRAETIAISNKCDELYDYFEKCGLVK